MSQARIGRIRMKAGGAEVRVMRREEPNAGENWRGKILEHSRKIAGFDAEGTELVGYFIIGVYANGYSSTAFRLDNERCPIPRRLWPAYVEERVREEMLTEQIVSDAIDRERQR